MTNLYSPYCGYPFRREDRGIFKTFRDPTTGQVVDPVTLLRLASESSAREYEEFSVHGVIVEQNTADDLLYALREFMVALSLGFPVAASHSSEAEFQSSYRRFVAQHRVGGTWWSEYVQRFRFAAQLTSDITGRIYERREP